MHVLITWGTKMGGTEGIARILGEALRGPTTEVDLVPAGRVRELDAYDAVIIGGALYANRWHRDARRFVSRNVRTLRRIPVWLFSSGPLDDSAERAAIPPARQVTALMQRIGALGHSTFGGRLPADATGFPAKAMAKEHAGDWRNPEHIRTWATQLTREFATAKPGHAIDHAARSLPRLIVHGVVGWAACGAVMGGMLAIFSVTSALIVHAVAAPVIFAVVGWNYFRREGAREPLPVAISFTGLVVALDLVMVAGLIERSLAMFESIPGTWLPFALIFATTYLTGLLVSAVPGPPERVRTTGNVAHGA